MGITLEKEQREAVESITQWYARKAEIRFKLAGLAGTGKTTIVKFVEEEIGLSENAIAYCAFTGKAAMVLSQKGTPATTMHKLIYDYSEDEITKEPVFTRKERLDINCKLIVVDEASMVSKELQTDLESYEIPILYVGDHGQLPPVGDGFSNLMQTADIKLEKIHRQAEGNPIIHLSKMVRLGAKMPNKVYGPGVIKMSVRDVTSLMMTSVDQILCGKNDTRKKLNTRIRQILFSKREGFEEGELLYDDKVICLRNNWNKGFINGMIGIVLRVHQFDKEDANVKQEDWWRYPPDTLAMTFQSETGEVFRNVPFDKEVFKGLVPDFKNRFIEAFDFAYAITVHKSQGSQYMTPMVFEEYLGDRSFHAKWLYTAITRAAVGLVWVTNK
jgi:ATP-dependent exoDNAse (exonuclease V) alpha subunit